MKVLSTTGMPMDLVDVLIRMEISSKEFTYWATELVSVPSPFMMATSSKELSRMEVTWPRICRNSLNKSQCLWIQMPEFYIIAKTDQNI